MGFVVFSVGVGAFVLGFLDPIFAPIALGSLAGGALTAAALRARRDRSAPPTISHLSVHDQGAQSRAALGENDMIRPCTGGRIGRP
jgi:hypothetical protein